MSSSSGGSNKIKLTPEQQAKLRAAGDKNSTEPELAGDELEQRIAPMRVM